MVHIVITGITGRMGQVLVRCVHADPGLTLVGATDRPGSPSIGEDVGHVVGLGALGVRTSSDLAQALPKDAPDPRVVVDFTTPEASLEHARLCAERRIPIVIGTTGFGVEQKATLAELGRVIPLVAAPNMSVGVNVVIQMAAELARALGEGFDIDIVETHHRMKKDAPSGTALRLAEEVAKALGRGPEDFRLSREGQVGERPPREIGLQTLRGGDVVGEHTLFFFGDGERVELTHRATSREQFARGALRAAKWLVGRPPGLYSMKDVLGFGDP